MRKWDNFHPLLTTMSDKLSPTDLLKKRLKTKNLIMQAQHKKFPNE